MNLPFSHGNPESPLAVIQLHPSKDESVPQSFPSGWAAREFSTIAQEAGIKHDFYHTCFYKSPVKSYSAKHIWNQNHDSEWLENHSIPRLIDELNAMPNLNILVLLGSELLEYFCEESNFTKQRGSVYPIKPSLGLNVSKAIATHKPISMHKDFTNRWIIQDDLAHALRESESPNLHHAEYEMIFLKSFAEVSYILSSTFPQPLAIDVETYRPLRLACISIATSPKKAYSISFEEPLGKSTWSISEEHEILSLLSSFISRHEFIIQNATYDSFVFEWMGLARPRVHMDTMLAHHLLWPELPHGLDFLCSVYTDQPYYKDEGKGEHKTNDWQTYLEYNLKDSLTTYEIAQKLEAELEESNQKDFYQENYLNILPPLVSASIHGIPVIPKNRHKTKYIYLHALELLSQNLESCVGRALNVASPKQVKEYLKNDLGLSVDSTNEESLKALLGENPDLIQLRLILSLRKIRKHLGPNYLGMKPDSRDLHVRTQFNLMGTTTGRLSGSSCPTGSGGTFQNLPRSGITVITYENKPSPRGVPQQVEHKHILPDIKNQFGFSYPWVILIPDYKQAESYIVAHLAQEQAWMDLMFSGADIHKTIAAENIFHVDISEITSQQRYLAKRVGHAANYGMGFKRFHQLLQKDEVHIPIKTVQEMMENYHAGFPGIEKTFHPYVQSELKRCRMLTNALGRKHIFLDRLDHNTFKAAYAYIPQSTVSDLMNRAMRRVYDQGVQILGQQHDSIWVKTHIDDLEKTQEILFSSMGIPIQVGAFPEFVIPNDLKYGPNLGTMREWTGDGFDRDWIHAVWKAQG